MTKQIVVFQDSLTNGRGLERPIYSMNIYQFKFVCMAKHPHAVGRDKQQAPKTYLILVILQESYGFNPLRSQRNQLAS